MNLQRYGTCVTEVFGDKVVGFYSRDNGEWVKYEDVAPILAESRSSWVMPDYLELVRGITDSRLTTMEGKELVGIGTRLMYDAVVVALQK